MQDTPLSPDPNALEADPSPAAPAPRCWCGTRYLTQSLDGRRCARGHFERSHSAARPSPADSACPVCRSLVDQAYLARWPGLREDGRRLPAEQVERLLTGSPPTRLTRRPEEPPDVLLLDVAMPEIDGIAVCAALKSDPNTAGIKVAMVTAMAEEDDQELGLAAGADRYITKPFSPWQLVTEVHQLLD
jgi:CheY-like chemotaxis protein